MQAESLVYTPIIGGPRSGLFTLELYMGPGRRFAPDSLAREIERATDTLRTRRRLFSLVYGPSAEVDEAEIRKLLRILRESGYVTSACVPALAMPEWLDLIQYRIMEVSDVTEYGVWAAQEVRYFPSETWIEPAMSRVNFENAAKYIMTQRTVPLETILDFQKNARADWGIVQMPKSVYQLRFFGPKEEVP